MVNSIELSTGLEVTASVKLDVSDIKRNFKLIRVVINRHWTKESTTIQYNFHGLKDSEEGIYMATSKSKKKLSLLLERLEIDAGSRDCIDTWHYANTVANRKTAKKPGN